MVGSPPGRNQKERRGNTTFMYVESVLVKSFTCWQLANPNLDSFLVERVFLDPKSPCERAGSKEVFRLEKGQEGL